MWRRLRNFHVLLHVRAYGDCPVSLAMTHMQWLQGQSGHESTGYTQSGPQCRWVASLAHRLVLETRTRANVNVRPRPLALQSQRMFFV